MKSLEISAEYGNKLSCTPIFARMYSLIFMITDRYHVILIRWAKYYANTLA